MADIFVSYKNEDRDKVAPLIEALRAAGLDTWWDQDIGGGERWRETIVRELDSAKLCLVVWSERSVAEEGRYVFEEAERAAARGAYLGVLIDPVRPPFGFAEWQAVDLSGWNGTADDPELAAFVDIVRARLEGRTIRIPTPRRTEARRRPAWLLPAAGALVLLAVAAMAALLWWPGRGSAQIEQPSDFVYAKLADFPCSWMQISNYQPRPDGAYVALQGIAGSPESVQATIMREATERGIALADLDVADLAAGPQETCAELDLLRSRMRPGRSRLAVIPQPGTLERTAEGTSGYVEYVLDYDRLPANAALLGLDSVEGVHVVIPDLRRHRASVPPIRTEGSRATYGTIWMDSNQGARNVGLILMTASGPIDLELVEAIGTQSDRALVARIDREAEAKDWQFELGLVRCGFETHNRERC